MESTLVTARINPCYWWCYFRGRRARKAGCYRRETMRYFFRAWKLSGSIDDLLAYALFRRDLGYRLPNRWVSSFGHEIHLLKPGRQILAVALLLESTESCPEFLQQRLPFFSGAVQLPAVLSCLHKNGVSLDSMQLLLRQAHDQQQQWRDAFREGLLKQLAAGGVCVVGNAGNMRRALLGDIIDQHGCVIRFNQFSSPEADGSDLGRKLDAWVVTPNFQITVLPESFSGVVILTGPDVRFRLLNWSGVSAVLKNNLTLLTVPLPVWRALVRELAAPPSAGMLLLAWLKDLLGSWSGVSVAGFGALSDTKSDYHYTNSKHKAFTRHNWAAESVTLRRWQQEGLRSLHG
ncbi:MAG: glycosyltransferase family 29 protein [Thiolinea sp.]